MTTLKKIELITFKMSLGSDAILALKKKSKSHTQFEYLKYDKRQHIYITFFFFVLVHNFPLSQSFVLKRQRQAVLHRKATAEADCFINITRSEVYIPSEVDCSAGWGAL